MRIASHKEQRHFQIEFFPQDSAKLLRDGIRNQFTVYGNQVAGVWITTNDFRVVKNGYNPVPCHSEFQFNHELRGRARDFYALLNFLAGDGKGKAYEMQDALLFHEMSSTYGVGIASEVAGEPARVDLQRLRESCDIDIAPACQFAVTVLRFRKE